MVDLPGYVPPDTTGLYRPPPKTPDFEPENELSRPSAEQIENISEETNLTYAGFNTVIPIAYGEVTSGGPVIAGPTFTNNNELLYAVALCYAGTNGIGGIQEVQRGDTKKQFNNSDTVYLDGVTVTKYEGLQTSPDPTLDNSIQNFSDVFSGIAYAVIQIKPFVNVTSFNEIQFRVKGRKCYDPRDGTIKYTENPVLFMHDFVTNDEFGLGVGISGVNNAADVADTIYGGLPRTRAGYTIQQAKSQADVLTQLALYAEVLWSYEGQDINIIPDVKADTIHSVDPKTIRKDSIDISTVSLSQIPTIVRVIYSDKTNDPLLASDPAEAKTPEHTLPGYPKSPSTIHLPGVFNRVEAKRRATQRLLRLQTPGRIRWQMQSPALEYQAGDVVNLPDENGLNNVNVRIMAQPEMIAPSLYQLTGEIYQDDQYPEFIPDSPVPLGAILVFWGDNIPLGWSEYFNTDHNLIKSANAVGAGGQSSTFPEKIIHTEDAGSHLGDFFAADSVVYASYQTNFANHDPYVQHNIAADRWNNDTYPESGNHNHYFTIPQTDVRETLHRRQLRFVQKDTAAAEMENGMSFFNDGRVNIGINMIKRKNEMGYLMGGTSNTFHAANDGYLSETNYAGEHSHAGHYEVSGYLLGNTRSFVGNSAGGHKHRVGVSIYGTLRSIALGLVDVTGPIAFPDKAIVLWDKNTIPIDWALCDGNNGTIDLSDRFIYITSQNLGVEFSLMTYFSRSVDVSTTYDGQHSHESTKDVDPPIEGYINHITEVSSHAHAINEPEEEINSDPPYYQLRFIQYIGN